MASSCRSFIGKSSWSYIKSAVRSNAAKSTNIRSATSAPFSLPIRSSPSPVRRFSLYRSPSELGCAESLLPLHSVVAAARMTSCLSTTSKSCRALSQGFVPPIEKLEHGLAETTVVVEICGGLHPIEIFEE